MCLTYIVQSENFKPIFPLHICWLWCLISIFLAWSYNHGWQHHVCQLKQARGRHARHGGPCLEKCPHGSGQPGDGQSKTKLTGLNIFCQYLYNTSYVCPGCCMQLRKHSSYQRYADRHHGEIYPLYYIYPLITKNY